MRVGDAGPVLVTFFIHSTQHASVTSPNVYHTPLNENNGADTIHDYTPPCAQGCGEVVRDPRVSLKGRQPCCDTIYENYGEVAKLPRSQATLPTTFLRPVSLGWNQGLLFSFQLCLYHVYKQSTRSFQANTVLYSKQSLPTR